MATKLRGLIQGAGFASQCHTEALRYSGVEIVGMVSRNPEIVGKIAGEMNIPYAGTDWNKALAELKPDLVALGTPGGVHLGPGLEAIAHGCHVFCDKPLATSVADAKELYLRSREAGVKTAYAASFRYQPQAYLARELVKEGAIGEPWEVECVSHYNLNPLIPFGWSHRIDQGGGRLGNNFTHKLSIVTHVLDGEVVAARGEVRSDMPKAPIVSGVHDFRTREDYAPSREEVEENPDKWSWGDVDSEWSYTVLTRIKTPHAARQPVSAVFRHSGLVPGFNDDYVAFYGSEGAIHISGAYAQATVNLRSTTGNWAEVPMRKSITDALPDIENDAERNWTQLAREFVDDIEGRGNAGYLTFRDGWIHQQVIDTVRAGPDWVAIAQDA